MSISFDRAVGYYDQTRALPEHQMELLVSHLLDRLPGEGLCLEIGVGTGRIALPLMDRGIDMVGVDISPEMLRTLVGKRTVCKVAVGDATRLPFADGTFTAAIAAHVLHLIARWTDALDELTRVIQPGGVILASRAGSGNSEWHKAVRRRFFLEAGDPPWPPGVDTIDQLDDEMRSRGAAVHKIEDVHGEFEQTIAQVLDALEKGIFAACWSIDEETRRRAAVATRQWAKAEIGDLDLPRPSAYRSDWRAYQLR